MVPGWNNLAGYSVGTSVGVTGLYIAFILPVILRLKAGDKFEKGAWSLGKHYKWINWIAIIWVAFITVIFMPADCSRRPDPVVAEVHLVRCQLRAAQVRGHRPFFGGWWVCRRRSGSRARCGWAPRRSWRARDKQEDQFLLPAET